MAQRRRTFTCILLIVAAVILESGPAQASTSSGVSANWAGYAVTGAKYRRVSGTWIVPTGRCTPGTANASAAWVGLGGFSQRSTALEQTGIEVDCTSSGRAQYSAWYELVPAASVTIPMKVHARDRISASVTVVKTQVALVLRNSTTGVRFAKTLHMRVAPDVSSAEWIVEAPSECTLRGPCEILPLTDFGAIRFSHAGATSTGGHTGTPGHRAWTSNMLTLSDGAADGSVATAPGASAIPSGLTSKGSSFSVTYQQGAISRSAPKRTFPGLTRTPASDYSPRSSTKSIP
jgi:Peptidase A4 family